MGLLFDWHPALEWLFWGVVALIAVASLVVLYKRSGVPIRRESPSLRKRTFILPSDDLLEATCGPAICRVERIRRDGQVAFHRAGILVSVHGIFCVLTCHRVARSVRRARKCCVTFFDGTNSPVSTLLCPDLYFCTDPKYNFSIIACNLENVPENVQPFELSTENYGLQPSETIYLLPLGADENDRRRIVRRVVNCNVEVGCFSYGLVLRSGNHGCPIFDVDHRLIGIHSASMTVKDVHIGIFTAKIAQRALVPSPSTLSTARNEQRLQRVRTRAKQNGPVAQDAQTELAIAGLLKRYQRRSKQTVRIQDPLDIGVTDGRRKSISERQPMPLFDLPRSSDDSQSTSFEPARPQRPSRTSSDERVWDSERRQDDLADFSSLDLSVSGDQNEDDNDLFLSGDESDATSQDSSSQRSPILSTFRQIAHAWSAEQAAQRAAAAAVDGQDPSEESFSEYAAVDTPLSPALLLSPSASTADLPPLPPLPRSSSRQSLLLPPKRSTGLASSAPSMPNSVLRVPSVEITAPSPPLSRHGSSHSSGSVSPPPVSGLARVSALHPTVRAAAGKPLSASMPLVPQLVAHDAHLTASASSVPDSHNILGGWRRNSTDSNGAAENLIEKVLEHKRQNLQLGFGPIVDRQRRSSLDFSVLFTHVAEPALAGSEGSGADPPVSNPQGFRRRRQKDSPLLRIRTEPNSLAKLAERQGRRKSLV